MSKILLVHKANRENIDAQNAIMANGLYYIAALLKENKHEVQVRRYSQYSDNEIEKEIIKFNPDIVGISCYTFNSHTVFEFCQFVKTINPKIKTILGGPHATVLDKEILRRLPYVDIVVGLEGEESMLEIANALDTNQDLSNVKGIAFRKEGEIVKTISRPPIKELDRLPNPSKYYGYMRLITSRGCPGQCTFCGTPQLWGLAIRNKSPEKILEEIQELNKKNGISYFIFSDDTFTANKKRTIDFCKLIINSGLKITWDCRSRVNFVCEERINWMKKAGCISISYGVESGSKKILKNIKKFINLDQVVKASQLTKKYGLHLNFFIIVGSPGEDDDSINETIALVKKTQPHNLMVSIMQITPDAKMAQMYNTPIDYWFEKHLEPLYFTEENDIVKLNGFVDKVYTEWSKSRGYYSFEDLARIIRTNPNSPHALSNLGLIYLEKNFLNDANICFRKAIELNPGHFQAYNNLGVLLVRIKDYDAAIKTFKQAIICNPEDLMARKNLGRLYFDMKKTKEAEECFNEILNLDPDQDLATEKLQIIRTTQIQN